MVAMLLREVVYGIELRPVAPATVQLVIDPIEPQAPFVYDTGDVRSNRLLVNYTMPAGAVLQAPGSLVGQFRVAGAHAGQQYRVQIVCATHGSVVTEAADAQGWLAGPMEMGPDCLTTVTAV
jgi:hypothetical protein